MRRGNVVKYNIQIKERGVPMKDMSAQKQVCSIGTGGEPAEAMRERSWEYGLPPYLQHDLDAYKEGLAEGSSLLDCPEASTSRRSTMARSHMNMPIICVRSFCGVNEVPDFTNCKRVPGRAYNGANGKKIAIEHQGEQYMLKFPPSGQGKRTELSYTNSCISEHIASTIFNMVGIPAQETILGTYDVGGKTKIVCACKDFTADGSKLFDFCSIKNTVIDSEYGGTGTELEDILDTIEKQQYVNPVEVLQHFWNVFVVDALLGNFDRHNGNWGFLYHDDTQTATLAPIYDCGSCLLPQADAQVMRAVLSNQDELNARIYRFPTSAIKQNDRKINYYDFLMATGNKDCNAAVMRMMPRFHLDKMLAFIREVPFLDELQRQFYQTYLSARMERIMVPVHRRIMEQQQHLSPRLHM